MDKTRAKALKINKEDFQAVILAIVAGVIVVSLFIVLTILTCFRVRPKFNDRNLELGKAVPNKVSNYVTGLPYLHEGIEVDFSQVDNMTVGDYEVVISGKLEYTCTIHIVDTTAPEIQLLGSADEGLNPINNVSNVYYDGTDGCIVLELGEYYDVFDVVDKIADASERYQVGLSMGGRDIAHFQSYGTIISEMFRIQECGNYVLSMVAYDEAGNSTSVDINAKVVDTKAPTFVFSSYFPYCAINKEYTVDDFVDEISDEAGVAEYYFWMNGVRADNISYTQIGTYNISFKAIDNNGNEAIKELAVVFDEAPEFVGVREEILIPVGAEFDYLQYFRAFDNTDGDITDRLNFVCDVNEYKTEGSYPYECTVADSHGLESTYCGTISVGSEDDRSYVLTAEEVDILNEYDYFSYEILEEDNYDAMIEMVKPTLVNLLRRYSDGSYTFGSGYVYKVDNDYIYIGTVEHVISKMISTVEFMFCDDEESIISIEVYGFERVDEYSETSLIKIPISSLPARVLLDLKQVYVDEAVYEEMTVGQEIVAYSGHWKNSTPTIRKVYVKRMDEQFLDDSVHCIVTSHNTKGGMSGCPLFDLRGRMVALCEGYWGRFNYDIYAYEYEGYQQRIDGINDLYERMKDVSYDDAG